MTDEHDEPPAARQSGVEQVALQHGVVLGDDWDHDCRVLGALRLVDRGREGQRQLVELSVGVAHGTAVEIDDDLSLLLINGRDEAEVAIECVPVVVVLDLHDLVADTVGEAEALDGRFAVAVD